LIQMPKGSGSSGFVAASAAMKHVVRTAGTAARSRAAVLIQGETGVGKDVIARFIHHESDCAAKPFVRVNCAALAAGMVESELFGHEKGAFTGAVARRRGLFESTDGGVIFLDEIGAMSLESQAKLLHVADTGEFRPMGAARPLRATCRIIAASNAELAQAVEQGAFRADLYHRLCVLGIHIPPLRDRPDDVEPLLRSFFRRHSGVTARRAEDAAATAGKLLAGYRWPGNVRELKNYAEVVALSVTAGGVEWLEALVSAAGGLVPSGMRDMSLRRVEREHILATLSRARWNISKAAQLLGMHRNTLAARLSSLPPSPAVHGNAASMREVTDAHVARVLALCGGNVSLAARVLGVSRAFVYSRAAAVTPA